MRRPIEPGIGIVFGAGQAPDANAHLIAAAPDLYTAIKDSMGWLEGTLSPCEDGCDCILHPLRADTAKAEGEAR
jgi:hypothetical protein